MTNAITVLFAACFIQLFGMPIYGDDSSTTSGYFNVLQNRRLVGHVIKTITTGSEILCAQKCLATNVCKSCNFRTTGKLFENCELSSGGSQLKTHDPSLINDEQFLFLSLRTEELEITKRSTTGSQPYLHLFQELPTTAGRIATTFVIEEKLFLAIGNVLNATGGNDNIMAHIYQLEQDIFTLNHTLNTLKTAAIEYFTINGAHFLVVANKIKGTTNKVDSVVYRWQGGKFEEFQRIATIGVSDIRYFHSNEKHFLLVSNRMNSTMRIYQWKSGNFSDMVQELTMESYKCGVFDIESFVHIACSRQDKTISVLKWSGSKLEHIQNIANIDGKGTPYGFHANGTVFLAIPVFKSTDSEIHSYIYRWNGTIFVEYQSLQTYSAMGWDSFTTINGDVLLVVANFYNNKEYCVNSTVYKMANNKFSLYQQLPTKGSKLVHAFTYEGKYYVAFVNYYDGNSNNINSTVYIWN